MQELTERERISLLMICGWCEVVRFVRFYKKVLLFNETFRRGQIGISKSTVERIVKRFEQSIKY